MAIEHRMNGAFGRHANVAIEPPDQELPDLARAPMWLLGFELDNQGLDLRRQLVGIADRSSGAVAQRLKPVLVVAIEDLVAGLAGYAEIPTDLCHGFPIQKPGNETKAFFHHRTLFPRHHTLRPKKAKSVTHVSGTKCLLCLGPLKRAFDALNADQFIGVADPYVWIAD